MIRPIAAFLHALDAALDAGTLSRTVLVLSRQLDNAHLLAASEEARADRAEAEAEALKIERDLARDEVDAHRRAEADWGTLSGELAAEILAEPNLPDLTDAGEVPIPLVLTDSAREVGIQRDRADALQRALQACEVDLAKMREAKLAADIRADVQRERAEQAERDRDTNARAAGAHIATIDDLRKRLDDALRAVHKPAPAEQIPGVAAADEPPTCAACNKPALAGSERTGEAEAVLLCGRCRATAEAEEAARPPRLPSREALYAAVMRRSDEINAAADDPPPTRPSERTAPKESSR